MTGAPGAGKSTLVDRMTRALRQSGKRVGVIAVDPTSPFSGGAILGDRIRMLDHHADPGVFIRSMATRGHLGGLAAATSDMALLLDAAGFDYVLVETVGVGQDEIEVARLADVVTVVLVPGAGDDVQALKAGIMEIADVYILNKADLAGAEKLERELQFLTGLGPRRDGWEPPIIRTVATDGAGIEKAIAAAIEFHKSGVGRARAQASWASRLIAMYRERVVKRLNESALAEAAADVAARRKDPYTVIESWVQGERKIES